MLKTALACLAVLVSSISLAPTAYASGSGSGSSSASRAEVRLEARMRSGRTEAKVAWRSDRGRTKLQAEIYRAKPSTTYTVTHMGKKVATIKTDSLGNGRYEIERGAPVMKKGDTVAVGALKGTLVQVR